MSLIRCEYCDMSYDGGRHDNCPHCNAPRPQTEPSREPVASIADAFTLNERRELADEGVTRFYADNVPYYTCYAIGPDGQIAGEEWHDTCDEQCHPSDDIAQHDESTSRFAGFLLIWLLGIIAFSIMVAYAILGGANG